MITKLKLDRLAELKSRQDVLRIQQQELIDGVLTPEIKSQIAEIDDEFNPSFDALRRGVADLEKRIKEEVIAKGETIKGETLQAVYSKGTRRWDLDKLDGYAVANEEINQFRIPGKPSASIRKVKL